MYADFISLMADFGTGWRDDPAKTYGAAIQFKLLVIVFKDGNQK